MKDTILVIGSSGQIGTELVMKLREMYGNNRVVASDIRPSSEEVMQSGPFEELDIMNEARLHEIVKKHNVAQVYLLAALLSATCHSKKNHDLIVPENFWTYPIAYHDVIQSSIQASGKRRTPDVG